MRSKHSTHGLSGRYIDKNRNLSRYLLQPIRVEIGGELKCNFDVTGNFEHFAYWSILIFRVFAFLI